MPSIAIIVGFPLLLLSIGTASVVYCCLRFIAHEFIHLEGMETYKDWPEDLWMELADYMRENGPFPCDMGSNADLIKLLITARLVAHDKESAGGEGITVYDYRVDKINATCSLIIITNDRMQGGPTVYELCVTD